MVTFRTKVSTFVANFDWAANSHVISALRSRKSGTAAARAKHGSRSFNMFLFVGMGL
jgi:hypothetical protein